MLTGHGTWGEDHAGRLVMISFTHEELIHLAAGLGPVVVEPDMTGQPGLVIEIRCGQPLDVLDQLRTEGELDDDGPVHQSLRDHVDGHPHGKDCQC